VVVDFLEGDPDQPIIVGSVYNAEQMPPYALPDNRTRSGLKSRSSLKGTEQHFNELRLEDKKGSEQVYFHAEKDFDRVVENNDTLSVGFREGGNVPEPGDRVVDVHNNEWVTVGWPTNSGQPPREVLPAEGSQYVSVWCNQEFWVGEGKGKANPGYQYFNVWDNQEFVVGSGKGRNPDGSQIVSIWKDRDVTLETGNDTPTVKMGNQTTKLNLGASKTDALQSIELTVGQSSIKIDQTGVTINGMTVKVEGTVMTEVKGLMTQVNGDAMLTCKGGITMIN
jgi:type VI secretion system secreted protein VgrG